jgi:hypothetical protein
MFGDFDLLIWVLVGLTAAISITKLIVLPFFKEFSKAGQKARKIEAENNETVSMRNLGKTAGSFAEGEISNYVKNLEFAHSQALKLYQEQKDAGASPEVLKPLEGRLKQLQWAMAHREQIQMLNNSLTGPLIQKIAGKILGGFL